MAMLESNDKPSTTSLSTDHVDMDRTKASGKEHLHFSKMPSLSISTATHTNSAPFTSGPPTSFPLSSTSTAITHEPTGCISPPESITRRSTREEQEPPFAIKSLPSIHEALGDRSILNPPIPPSSTTFPERSLGHSNPFSQPGHNPPPTQHSLQTELRPCSAGRHDQPPFGIQLTPITNHDAKPLHHNKYPYPPSPRGSLSSQHTKGSPVHGDGKLNQLPPGPPQYSHRSDAPLHYSTAPPYSSHPSTVQSKPSTNVQYEPIQKIEESKNPSAGPSHLAPYGDTVKRHLDVYDTELAFNEVSEASLHTLDFSRYWIQRSHQANRAQIPADAIPPLQDVDEAIRQCHRIMENLSRIRESSVAQQRTVSEERARLAQLLPSDQYRTIMDEYKASGFASGDAKKRRGKAAPPGRCHSCNRAETPEWRRGPDGARTLCNACGLHYAKLTRKLGANKTGHMTASSLRPKGLDGRP